MNKSFTSFALLAALLGGCVSLPPPPNHPGLGDPSNPSAPEASGPRFRPSLVASTRVYLNPSAGQGAQTMDHSKMQGMEGMQGMDHSQMKSMDHSKMPGMGASPSTAASSPTPNKATVEKEMKQTSDEMKRLSDGLKAKSDAAKAAKKPGNKSQAGAVSSEVIYTCPMHPQIKEAKPCHCPICGMTLVKKNRP
jgi:uncharacterized protein involved in copper resistance